MNDRQREWIEEVAVQCLSEAWLHDNGDGTFTCEIYADYRDEMYSETAIEILKSEEPMDALLERVEDWYAETELDGMSEFQKKIMERIELTGEFSHTELPEVECYLRDLLPEIVLWEYPTRKFLNQKFQVNIMVDTGDGNYDYTLNSVYPCWGSEMDDAINSKASIVWLSKSQGYGKRQMKQELRRGDVRNPQGYLPSLRQELANLPSHMAVLTFLVEMSLEELIELNKGIRLQERNGHFYDATKNPYCGYITLDKRTETGLYDPWSGGGSVFEIQLEKDVHLPIRFIRSVLPDGGDGRYSVESVYGMCSSVWRPDMVKEIHLPQKV